MESESDGAVVFGVVLGLVEGDDLRLRALPTIIPAATRLKEGLHVFLRNPGHHTRSETDICAKLVQGDTSGCSPCLDDIKTKVGF